MTLYPPLQSRLEFTLETLVQESAAGSLPKLKHSDYDSKNNRGGQLLNDVKIATVWYLYFLQTGGTCQTFAHLSKFFVEFTYLSTCSQMVADICLLLAVKFALES